MVSIAEHVLKDASNVENEPKHWPNFFGYSPATDEEGNGFKLGIMTREQCEWLKALGNRGLTMDRTHNSTRYKLTLVSSIVLDNRQKGLPVAHWLCKSESEAEIVPLFQAIKSRQVVLSYALERPYVKPGCVALQVASRACTLELPTS
uniref:MULE transposase domain-containing protein n=1 Tax=Plectus sambesii TaxID=2011161 RepID=A0A914XK53_9BILA